MANNKRIEAAKTKAAKQKAAKQKAAKLTAPLRWIAVLGKNNNRIEPGL